MIFAKMKTGRAARIRQLSDMEGGWLFAMLTFHGSISTLA